MHLNGAALPMWFLLGFFGTLAVVFALARVGGWGPDEGDAKSSEPDKALS